MIKNKFINLTLGCLSLLSFGACQNEISYIHPDKPKQEDTVELAKATEILAYSNNTIITRSLNPTITKWQGDTKIEGWPETTDRGEQVSTNELNYVMDYLAKHPNEGYTECDLTTYFLQNVGGSYASYHLDFVNNGSVHHSTDITGSNQMDYFELYGIHVNDYNASYGPRVYCENLPLSNPRYHDSYASLTQENHYRFYYIPNEDGNGYSLYLCFDYATNKYDNGQLDFDGDGVYNDWVIKIIPGDGSTVVPPVDENEPEVKPENPPVVDPSDSTINEKYTINHVEINLEIEDHGDTEGRIGAWLASHLSIHVRANTDVNVFIPVPVDYYCEADDLAIVQKHADDLMIHGGPESITYNINGNNVTLTVDYQENGIYVSTTGMNQDVLDYLYSLTGDGLTFEIWNYYNLDINDFNRNGLKGFLDKTTVSFTDNPSLYVNAFYFDDIDGVYTESINPWDCKVSPQNYPAAQSTGYWYNGSPYNDLYYKN